MTPKPVQAVFFWRGEGTSVFKAAYGRKPRKANGAAGAYTKDFHQPRHELARALERAMGIDEGGDTAVDWRWPGGSYTGGRLKAAADFESAGGRLNLRWETDNAPPPWRLTPTPTATTLSTLQGTPDLDTEAGADAELKALIASGESPWLIAVHLYGEGAVLHARVVLENPQPGREIASWDSLPATVRNAMRALPKARPGGFIEFAEGTVMTVNPLVARILQAFEHNPNVLLVGPPGTGKTVALEEVQRLYEPALVTESNTFDPDLLHKAFAVTKLTEAAEPRTETVVFHPSYAYENLVMGLLPDPVPGGVSVKPHPGPLLDLAHFADDPNHRALLVVDEFNRGSAAAIFGDTLALLDADKRSTPGDAQTGASIPTPYAYLNPKTRDQSADLPEKTRLPRSLRILAAMNSADRSVAPLDAALRRRFAIVHVGPDYEALTAQLKPAATSQPARDQHGEPGELEVGHIKALALDILRSINYRIEIVLGRDFLLGPSVIWNVDGADTSAALRALAVAVDTQVLGTLALTFADNDSELAVVLNVAADGTSGGAAKWEKPTGLLANLPPRLRLTEFQALGDGELLAALKTLN